MKNQHDTCYMLVPFSFFSVRDERETSAQNHSIKIKTAYKLFLIICFSLSAGTSHATVQISKLKSSSILLFKVT